MKKKFTPKQILIMLLGIIIISTAEQVQAQNLQENPQMAPRTSFMMIPAVSLGGTYDMQFIADLATDCDNSVFYVDIQIRAASAATTFRLADQNYRFNYDESLLANPRIEQELAISGLMQHNDGTVSLYGGHTLIGTLGPTVSYNVELMGGDGYLVDANWVSIGRLAFDVLDANACIDLLWNDESTFPPTYVGEINNGVLGKADGVSFMTFSACMSELCPADLCPNEMDLPGMIAAGTYVVKINIQSDGTVASGTDVILKAGNSIIFNSNFIIEPQANFSAEIEGCTDGN